MAVMPVLPGVFRVLDPLVPAGLDLLLAPFDWRPDDRTSLQPDLLVFHEGDAHENTMTAPPRPSVEVLSLWAIRT